MNEQERAHDESIEVIVEIPAGGRNKYEYDHERHLIRLDRRLFSATVYPTDYGFVPDTLAKDGDPLDALVLLADPTFPGCLVRVRVLGVFWMRDEAGPDAKLITVLEHDPNWDRATDLADVPQHLLNEIEHFFSSYKDLEPGKISQTAGFEGRDAAFQELAEARRAFGVAHAAGLKHGDSGASGPGGASEVTGSGVASGDENKEVGHGLSA